MEDLKFQVVLDKNIEPKVKGVVAYGAFETDDPSSTPIYQDVDSFFRDLILGRPLPLTFAAKEVESFGVILAIALFLHRELAIHPDTPAFLACTNLADHGIIGLAHMDRDLAALFKFMQSYMASATKPKAAIETVVGWIRGYILEKRLPALPPTPDPPRVIDIGTDGFVLATYGQSALVNGWEELFRLGYLRGLLLEALPESRWRALGAKKSDYLRLDLTRAAEAFNEAEMAMAEPAEWQVYGNWLLGPEGGTLLTPSAMMKVLVRA